MQAKKINDGKQIQMEITITGDDLKGDTESKLLRRAIGLLELLEPDPDPRQTLCDLTGFTNAQIGQALWNTKTSIGGLNWVRLQIRLGIPLYDVWLEAQKEKTEK